MLLHCMVPFHVPLLQQLSLNFVFLSLICFRSGNRALRDGKERWLERFPQKKMNLHLQLASLTNDILMNHSSY